MVHYIVYTEQWQLHSQTMADAMHTLLVNGEATCCPLISALLFKNERYEFSSMTDRVAAVDAGIQVLQRRHIWGAVPAK